jgi:hypothetical protein
MDITYKEGTELGGNPVKEMTQIKRLGYQRAERNVETS